MSADADMMDVDSASANGATSRLPVTVEKPIPYTFDLGNLLCTDANPLPSSGEDAIRETARDCAQVLINQLLSTCPVRSTKEGVLLDLPTPITPLPREKPAPKPKEPTKWELFAAKKGIKDKKKEGNLVYDEEKGEWVPKWGYKGKNKDQDDQWLVEVDEKKEAETGEADNPRALPRKERVERVKRNERKQRSNEARARKKGA
ncbi:Ribosomal biogenesis regulatory protein [Neofusicoccum parvum]|uniref:Ribosomal biogenesis regulatory protein n=1 Tax=Neofusicoccum parvum TaxID=310453 RepID=A0ACB5RVZ7_9PEZI|nr:Ribosomal biogenesis regulatory protein [Neofusicoccum parvum]GME51912.1 Ribosomal biogenesis regulatory protein [Neofusicoccum parvum]